MKSAFSFDFTGFPMTPFKMSLTTVKEGEAGGVQTPTSGENKQLTHKESTGEYNILPGVTLSPENAACSANEGEEKRVKPTEPRHASMPTKTNEDVVMPSST